MDFNFAYFANFNFAHFEIKESFRLIWVKLQNRWLHLQISISGIYKVLIPAMGFIFAHSVYKGSFWQTWVKITEWPIDLKVSILVLISQIMVFHFVHFEYKKEFWYILIKFIVYKISLSSSRSNKKQSQLVDFVIGRL